MLVWSVHHKADCPGQIAVLHLLLTVVRHPVSNHRGFTQIFQPSYSCRYPYVLSGYRSGGTYARCLLSLFEWHTETFNAWTMIAGSSLSIFLLYRALGIMHAGPPAAPEPHQASGSQQGAGITGYTPPGYFTSGYTTSRGYTSGSLGSSSSYWEGIPDEVPIWLMTVSTLLHAPFSIGFHLFRGMRKDVYNLWRRLDQARLFGMIH